MREIKFRCWDKEKRAFHYFEVFNVMAEKAEDYWEEPQQYTGLKDSKNKEIYERDIIEWDKLLMDCVSTERCRMTIEFFVDQEMMAAKFRFPGTVNKHTIEIIGNIYENPELLDKK